MSARPALVGSTLSLLMSASLLLAPGPGAALNAEAEPGDRPAARAAAHAAALTSAGQKVHLLALPQIVQHGGRVASPDDARAAFTATIQPTMAGRAVHLQVRRGGVWESVATVRQDARGRAQFAARASRDGRPLTYRVKAARFGGLAAVNSRTVSTERWLTPTWTDEFKGTALSRQWGHRGQAYEPQSLRRCSKGSPKAAKVVDGALRLSIMRDPSRRTLCPAVKDGQVAGRYAYRLNGHVGTDSSFSFRYGVAAARVRFQQLRGQHGSFWMQPIGGMSPGSTGHEIDVVEFFGRTKNRTGLFSYIHRYQNGSIVKAGANIPNTFLHGPRDGWGKSFHVFSVQWTPRKLVFRIDGKETWRIGGRISRVPQYLILSMLASDYELPLMQDRQLPQHMNVDWVRVWETGR